MRGVPGVPGVPGVSADASNTSGMAVALSLTPGNVVTPADGTSAAPPFWAGTAALADQYAGRALGFINRCSPPAADHPPAPTSGASMSLTALIIGGALLLAMICVSFYGAVALPSGAQMPVHFGPAGWNRWVPRNTGLVFHPALGAVVYAIIVITVRDHQAHGGLGPAAGLSIALGVLLIVQVGALAVALSRSRRGS